MDAGMAESRSLTTISEADFDAIESAVMETDRGRWFLKEYARRNRHADTQLVLDAIGRLEQAVAGDRVAQDIERMRATLKEMATAISRTKTEIASIHSAEQDGSLFKATEALDGITRTTERATSDILAAAEHVQECAWTLREDGADTHLCDELDRRATEIYTACSFQDITAQRTAKIVHTLRYLESRIDAMIASWDQADGASAAQGGSAQHPGSARPGLESLDLDQSDIDSVIVGDDLFDGTATEPPVDRAFDRSNATGISEVAFTLVEEGSTAASAEQVDDGPAGPAPRPEQMAVALPPRAALDFHDDVEWVETTDYVAESAPAPQTASAASAKEALAEIDLMSTRDKLRAFT
jgi:hypothetical protein